MRPIPARPAKRPSGWSPPALRHGAAGSPAAPIRTPATRSDVATGTAECCVCPVCRAIAAMRDPTRNSPSGWPPAPATSPRAWPACCARSRARRAAPWQTPDEPAARRTTGAGRRPAPAPTAEPPAERPRRRRPAEPRPPPPTAPAAPAPTATAGGRHAADGRPTRRAAPIRRMSGAPPPVPVTSRPPGGRGRLVGRDQRASDQADGSQGRQEGGAADAAARVDD